MVVPWLLAPPARAFARPRTAADAFAAAWRRLGPVAELELLAATEAYVQAADVQRVLADYDRLAPVDWRLRGAAAFGA